MRTIGPWRALDGGYGATVAVAGAYTVAAQLGYLTVWAGQRLVAHVTAQASAPGRPRIVQDRLAKDKVYWGPGVLDLASGRLALLASLAAETTGTVVPRGVGISPQGYSTATYAWSPDGSMVAVTAQHASGPHPPTASAVVRDNAGQLLATLWECPDIAPRAAWVGRTLVVIGTRQPGVFRRNGSRVVELDGATPPVRIEASSDETRLLMVEHTRLTLWDTATWAPVGIADGQWLDAALAPDGQLVIAVDFAGTLHTLDGTLASGPPLPAPGAALGGALGVALDDSRVVAAFPGEVHTAPLAILSR
ncbi:MAG: hypothetical protein ACRDZS_02700 [Acidimicrobiales bacterium]